MRCADLNCCDTLEKKAKKITPHMRCADLNVTYPKQGAKGNITPHMRCADLNCLETLNMQPAVDHTSYEVCGFKLFSVCQPSSGIKSHLI